MNERLPWFHCYPTKLLGALAGMSPDQQLVYVIMLLRIYEVRGPCPDTLDAIARRTGINKRRASDALDALFRSGKLKRVADGIINAYAERVLEYGDEEHERRVRAGSEGGRRAAENRKGKQPPPHRTAALEVCQEDSKEEKKEERKTPAPAEAGLFADDALPQSEQWAREWPKDYHDQFWKAYPRRTEKKAAMAKLDAIRKGGKVRWQVFLDGVQRYAQHMRGTEERYIKHPTTWLNRGCWDDEFGPDPGGGPRPGGSRGGIASLLVQMWKGRDDDVHEGLEPVRALPAR